VLLLRNLIVARIALSYKVLSVTFFSPKSPFGHLHQIYFYTQLKRLQYTKMTKKMQLYRIIYYSLAAVHVSSDIFAHHQEDLHCITASGITHVCRCRLAATYVIPEAVIQFRSSWWWAKISLETCRAAKEYLNYSIQLHLVGHFRTLCHDARKHKYQV